MSSNTQNYVSYSIEIPDGYEILCVNASAQHSTVLIGQAIVSGSSIYLPYISTTGYSGEMFTVDVYLIKL